MSLSADRTKTQMRFSCLYKGSTEPILLQSAGPLQKRFNGFTTVSVYPVSNAAPSKNFNKNAAINRTMPILSSFGIEPRTDYNTSGLKTRFCLGSLVVQEEGCTSVLHLDLDGPHDDLPDWHLNTMVRVGYVQRPQKVTMGVLFKEVWDHIPTGIGSFA